MDASAERRSKHYPFHYWHQPRSSELGESATEFLHRLRGPTHVYLSGRDPSRCRVVVTLLHGNEPSGFFGLYQLLKRGLQPAVDLHCFIASVEAAQAAPVFFHRMLPGQEDINRCFRPPFTRSPQSRLAKGILDTLEQLAPEAVIDVHNTSGSGPAFGVTTFKDARHEALISLFTPRLMVTDIRLGALMEISNERYPVVTIECGGSQDLEANRLAAEGLEAYACRNDVLSPPPADFALDYFYNPLRLEMREGVEVSYQENLSRRHVVTLFPDIERYNFGYVEAGTALGYVQGKLEDALRVVGSQGESPVETFLDLRNDLLRTGRQLKLFMVTTNAEIARRDCLFYLVPAERHVDAQPSASQQGGRAL